MSDFTSARLAELRAVAEAATPGPWLIDDELEELVTVRHLRRSWRIDAVHAEDSAHIAAFDPPTVLALIAALEAKTAEVEDARKYRTLPPGYVWQDYYSPDEVIKIRREAEFVIEATVRERDEARAMYDRDLRNAKAARDQIAEMERDEKARADRAEAALERVKALHRPGPIVEVWGKSRSQSDDFQVCRECTDEDNNWDGWPCETIQAIQGAEE